MLCTGALPLQNDLRRPFATTPRQATLKSAEMAAAMGEDRKATDISGALAPTNTMAEHPADRKKGEAADGGLHKSRTRTLSIGAGAPRWQLFTQKY